MKNKTRFNLNNKDWKKVDRITVAKITGKYDWWKVNDNINIYKQGKI